VKDEWADYTHEALRAAVGILHLALREILNASWGWVLIAIGLLSLFVMRRVMYLASGVVLLIAAGLNIASVLNREGFGNPWMAVGFLQIGWAGLEFSKFNKYALVPAGSAASKGL